LHLSLNIQIPWFLCYMLNNSSKRKKRKRYFQTLIASILKLVAWRVWTKCQHFHRRLYGNSQARTINKKEVLLVDVTKAARVQGLFSLFAFFVFSFFLVQLQNEHLNRKLNHLSLSMGKLPHTLTLPSKPGFQGMAMVARFARDGQFPHFLSSKLGLEIGGRNFAHRQTSPSSFP
jgi:hypothetical protein